MITTAVFISRNNGWRHKNELEKAVPIAHINNSNSGL